MLLLFKKKHIQIVLQLKEENEWNGIIYLKDKQSLKIQNR